MIVSFGGTFDPLHNGHLRVALEVSQALSNPVRLMPCHNPPHRHAQIDSAHRVAMLGLALVDQDDLQLDLRELDRAAPSYTVETLRGLRAEVGESEAVAIVLGADAFAGLSSWYQWTQLFRLAHIVVLSRAGRFPELDGELAAEWYARKSSSVNELREQPAGKIFSLPVTALDISASKIRALLAAGDSAKYLLPDSVLAYIEQHKLYQTP